MLCSWAPFFSIYVSDLGWASEFVFLKDPSFPGYSDIGLDFLNCFPWIFSKWLVESARDMLHHQEEQPCHSILLNIFLADQWTWHL